MEDDTLDSFATVNIRDDSGNSIFPPQRWPIVGGRVKIISLLSPGANNLTITREHSSGSITQTVKLNYIPLLQTPPLHLAIMVAKDSPLLIDCPPAKQGAFSLAHSSLDAAVAKFRMTAYMWQALTAEDMRMKGLGRRSFRLEEEWGADTTSSSFVTARHDAALHDSGAMRSTAKIHIVRSERTVAELRSMDYAQQNKSARNRDKLFDFFKEALAAHGSPFETSGYPIVAGLILDSHYSVEKNIILAHAALGCHDGTGLSLGIMGSHLTYSWPRFLEEVSDCLLDDRNPGETVGNDNGECGSFWEACAIGQGAFLHEVGHAFGAPHTTGIMARGYSQDWPRNFVVRTAYCTSRSTEGIVVIDGETRNQARWDLHDALSFRSLPHFWSPGDPKMSKETRSAAPTIKVEGAESEKFRIEISCAAGIAQITFNDTEEPSPSIAAPINTVTYTLESLRSRFHQNEPLKLSVLGMNGKSRTIKDAWRFFGGRTFVLIPGTKILLHKQSVMSKQLEETDGETEEHFWEWATLLTRKRKDGSIEHATKVDIRTGCILDGAYVHFPDGTQINCGPRVSPSGGDHYFGGHAAEAHDIPKGQDIVKVEVSREDDILRGIRMTLRNGVTWGALSGMSDQPETLTLGEFLPPWTISVSERIRLTM